MENILKKKKKKNQKNYVYKVSIKLNIFHIHSQNYSSSSQTVYHVDQ
jgi:hypothetical protein